MNEALHPLSLGEILDTTGNLYRSRFLVYLGIAAIPVAVLAMFFAAFTAVTAWLGSSGQAGNVPVGAQVAGVLVLGIGGLLLLPAWIGTSALGGAAMTEAAARGFLGHATGIREAYKAAWSRGWRYIGLYLLQQLIAFFVPGSVAVVLLLFLGFGSALAGKTGATGASAALVVVTLLLIAVVIAFAVWFFLRICMAFAVSVVEQAGPVDSLKRASVLSKGTQGRLIVLFLLVLALHWVAVLALAIPLFTALALIPSLRSPQHANAVATFATLGWYGASFAAQAFTRPVQGIALTLFYFDQRIRKEGFDIEWMMRQAGLDVPPPSPAQEPVMELPGLLPGEEPNA